MKSFTNVMLAMALLIAWNGHAGEGEKAKPYEAWLAPAQNLQTRLQKATFAR